MNAADLLTLDDAQLARLADAVSALLEARRKLAELDLDTPRGVSSSFRTSPEMLSPPGLRPGGNGARPPIRAAGDGKGDVKADLGPALAAFSKGPLNTAGLARTLKASRATATRRIERMSAEG